MILEYFRNRKSLGWFFGAALLGLVIIAFVALYFPDFMGDPATAALRRGVAWVDGEPIPASVFLDRYRDTARRYQEQTGGSFSTALARQLGIPEQVVSELIRSRVLVLEAERHGLQVTDQEVGASIRTTPAFQQNGVFIGTDAYLDLLRGARLNPRDFEASLRSDLLAEKLRLLITESPHVSDLEVVQEYRRRNENASLELWFLPAAARTAEVEFNEEEVRQRYDADPASMEIPVQRRIRYLTLSEQTIAEEVSVRRREVQRHYDRNLFEYQTGEQAEASHILLRPESEADEEATRTLAARLAERARDGEDFAELARTYSADEATAEAGGVLGTFGPEEMVPEFSEAVFAMMPGEISDPIRTDYGFHVVRLQRRQAAETQPLEEVENEIEARLRREKAAQRLSERVIELGDRVPGASSLEELSTGYPLLIAQESGFFSANEPVAELGSAEVAALAFETEIGRLAGPVQLPLGFAFIEVVEERLPHIPDFEDIRDALTTAVRNEMAMERTREAARALAADLVNGASPDLDPTPIANWFRGSPLGAAGILPQAEALVFAAEPGEVVGPLETEHGFALVRVESRSGYDPATFEEQKESFRDQLAEEKRQRWWSSFFGAAANRYEIRIDRQALYALLG